MCIRDSPVSGQVARTLQHIAIYPASHYVTTKDKLERAIVEIDKELDEREAQFLAEGKAVEAQRIRQRTRYDIEMLRELGYCTGIENYSRVISGRPVGSPPLTLIDYFPKDFLLFVDESHVTLPQVRAMYNGDRARKDALQQLADPVPLNIRNAPTRLMKELGYGAGYQFAHDTEEKLTDMQCLPDSLLGKRYYRPTDQGQEGKFKTRLEQILAWKAQQDQETP